MPIKAAVMGLGNIGRYAIEALEIQPDFTCVGVIRRKESLGKDAHDLRGVPEYASLADLEAVSGKPDVVLLCAPSRKIPEVAGDLLGRGYNTVDSFDIHDRIVETIGLLEAQAVKGKAVAITAAGWDPGTDSVMRALFEAMAPVGVTFTNFGRGRSMGHSVAARAIAGVADATSITIPLGGGRHSRLVYVVLEEGATFEAVKAAIQADPYFSHDPLDVRQVTQSSLRRAIGIVQQDVFLFADTVRENIRYGRPDATDEEIVEAAKRAEIYDDIMAMPHGFDTYVGERGTMLSGGQKQRVSIARIFLKNPPILILDEATSALDSVTEVKIQHAFDELSRGRTTLIIAHRLSTIRAAHRILVIRDGRIAEQGTHQQLLAANGAYAGLYHTQNLGEYHG